VRFIKKIRILHYHKQYNSSKKTTLEISEKKNSVYKTRIKKTIEKI